MNTHLCLVLQPNSADEARLAALQVMFAAACNHLAPLVQQTRCWNRVALHHLAYKDLRERFPQLGSQMACNVIYSVSRACRTVYQGQGSPFNISLLGDRPLPMVRFEPNAPVYFDKHTLSIRDGQASMFTLDGRIRFRVALEAAAESRFRSDRLREISLTRRKGSFLLDLFFSEVESPNLAIPIAKTDVPPHLPAFVRVDEASEPRTATTAKR
jgi:hypothetical protein